MSLWGTLDTLPRTLRQAHEQFYYLWLTAAQDHPRESENDIIPALVERVGDGATLILGDLKEAVTRADRAREVAGPPTRLDEVCRALKECQEALNRAHRRYADELRSYERLVQLARLGRERSGEWRGWTASARDGIESCRPPLDAATDALQGCWLEIAERVTLQSVTVTSIGHVGPLAATGAEYAYRMANDNTYADTGEK